MVKPTLRDGAELERDETRATAAWALDRILQLLHPFMPFITEELWEQTGPRAEPMLALSSWPRAADIPVDAEAGAEMDWTIRLVEAVRSVRAEMNVPAGARIEMRFNGANAESKRRLDVHADTIATLARVGEVKLDGGMPAGSVQIVLDEAASSRRWWPRSVRSRASSPTSSSWPRRRRTSSRPSANAAQTPRPAAPSSPRRWRA